MVLGAGVAAVLAPPASGYFVGSGGQATTRAAVGAVNAPTGITVGQAGAPITISWTAATRSSGGAVSGYTVTRSDGAAICGTNAAPVTGTSCVDDAPPSGSYSYTVTAVFATTFSRSGSSADTTVLQAPEITSAPAALSAALTPSFSFSGGQGSGYQCSLNGGAYSACTSPDALSGLSSGAQTFAIRAVTGSSYGPTTTYAWTIDTTPPTIQTGPTNPTTSANATLTFSDPVAAYTLLCSVNGGAFGSCSSPQSYTGLADGSHTFAVEARSSDGATTAATSWTWVSDTTPPVATLSFPAAGGDYDDSAFAAGCDVSPFSAANAICGHATDSGTGVQQVLVSIQQGSGEYWNGSSFSSATEVKLSATGTGNWTLPFTASSSTTPDGTYTVRAYGVDVAGNVQTAPAVASFTLDNVAPAPTFTGVNGGGLSGLSSLLGLTGFNGTCGAATGDTPTVNWAIVKTAGGTAVSNGSTACTSGMWSVTLGAPLTALLGYTLTISQTDAAGNTGTSTIAVVVV